MIKLRKGSAWMALVFFFWYTAANAQESALDRLIVEQETALKALEQAVTGRNPYFQWSAAQNAVESVRNSSEKLAREGRKLKREGFELAAKNQKLGLERNALLEEVQGLQVSNRNLVSTNDILTKENQQVSRRYEQLDTGQNFLSMAFYTALALAFLGFGGLIAGIPNSRLERRLKHLEITTLENQLRKEADTSRTEEDRPRRASRPMAEIKAADIKPPKAEPGIAAPKAATLKIAETKTVEAKKIKAEPSKSQEAKEDKGQVVPLRDKARQAEPKVKAEATKPAEAEDDTKKDESRRKQKRKKKKQRVAGTTR